jgi:hypothetical protein
MLLSTKSHFWPGPGKPTAQRKEQAVKFHPRGESRSRDPSSSSMPGHGKPVEFDGFMFDQEIFCKKIVNIDNIFARRYNTNSIT